MSVWLIAFEKIDFKQMAQTNLGRPLKQQINSFYVILGTHTDGEMNVICLASYLTNMAAK